MSIVTINLAGFLRQLPTSIRQVLDPSFFASHIASLTISSAFAVLAGRIAHFFLDYGLGYLVDCLPFEVENAGSSSSPIESGIRGRIADLLETLATWTSGFIAVTVGVIVFSFSHLGAAGLRSVASSVILILSVAISMAVLKLPKVREAIAETKRLLSHGAAGRRFVDVFSEVLALQSVKKAVRIAVLLLAATSFGLGQLRMDYLLTQEPSEFKVNDKCLYLRVIGTTSNGVVTSNYHGDFSRIIKTIEYQFITFVDLSYFVSTKYSGIHSVIKKSGCEKINSI